MYCLGNFAGGGFGDGSGVGMIVSRHLNWNAAEDFVPGYGDCSKYKELREWVVFTFVLVEIIGDGLRQPRDDDGDTSDELESELLLKMAHRFRDGG